MRNKEPLTCKVAPFFYFNPEPMPIDFRKIVELKKTREDIANLVEYERGLSRPVLKDFSLVEVMYRIFKDILSQRDCAPDIESVTQRKKFVFITLYLFCPGVLIGGCMPKGLRKALSMTLGVRSGTSISNDCDDVVFLYQNYKDFCEDTDSLFDEILRRLEAHSN